MKKIILPIIVVLTCASSCMRLDNNFFNSTKLEKYSFDASPTQEIAVDASYTIPANLIHQVALTSDDNGNKAKIYGIYLGDIARIATDTVIMYFHGTRDNMDFYWSRAKLLANVGHKNRFGVFMIDYRSYGMSEGTPTESALHADAAAAIQWLKNNGLTGERLIVYGYSLGTAAATFYAANPASLVPSKVILEAPFGSAAVMVDDATTLALPASYFTNIKVDNAETIKHVQQPLMWIHGINDDFLAMKTHGELVYKNYKGSWSEAHRIPGALHGDVPVVWGYENYKKAVENFIMAALH